MYKKRYCIVTIDELSNINFREIFQSSLDTTRKSNDGTKALISYNFGDTPEICADKNQYTHTEIIEIMLNSEWVSE